MLDLGGTLGLVIDDAVDPGDLLGATFRLFDWPGPLGPDQRFAQIISQPGHRWDTSRLYTTGEIELLSVPESSALVLTGVLVLVGLSCPRTWKTVWAGFRPPVDWQDDPILLNRTPHGVQPYGVDPSRADRKESRPLFTLICDVCTSRARERPTRPAQANLARERKP
ncbi:MAG: hypothetical protein ACC645_18600 [Pirellulales bacterium]